ALWRRRPTTDSPRPAGRRRGGVLARGVRLVRRSRHAAPVVVTAHAASAVPAVAVPAPTLTVPTAGSPSAAPPRPVRPVDAPEATTPPPGTGRSAAGPSPGGAAAETALLTGERTLAR